MKKAATKALPYDQLIKGYIINTLIEYGKQFKITTMVWLKRPEMTLRKFGRPLTEYKKETQHVGIFPV